MHSLVSNVVSAVLGNYHAAMPRNIQPLSLLLKQSFIAHNNMYLLLVAIGIQYLGCVSTCMALKVIEIPWLQKARNNVKRENLKLPRWYFKNDSLSSCGVGVQSSVRSMDGWRLCWQRQSMVFHPGVSVSASRHSKYACHHALVSIK